MTHRQTLVPQRVPTEAELSMLVTRLKRINFAMGRVSTAVLVAESIFLSDTDLHKLMIELDMALLIVKDIRSACRTVEVSP